jgi:hypothetical protein
MRTTLLLLVLVLSPFRAFAAEDGTLSLSPAVVMLRGDHGQSTTQVLRLHNTTSRPFSFDLVAQDVVIVNGKRTFSEAGSIGASIASTAIFSPRHVDIPPGRVAMVQLTVTLPLSTPQRAIVALFRGTSVVMSGNVPMTASLGTLVTFAASDTVELTATPLAVRTQSRTANLAFSQSCTNSGHEPLVARGVMVVLDAKGVLIGKSALQPHRLIPGESANLGAEYPGELDPGRYKVLVTYDYDGGTLTRAAEVEVR